MGVVSIEKRIRALEARYTSEPVILYFADGSIRRVWGRCDFLFTLLVDVCRANADSEQAAILQLIRESVSAYEPGGGRLSELLRICRYPSEPDQNAAHEA